MSMFRHARTLLLASTVLGLATAGADAHGWRSHEDADAFMQQLDLSSAQRDQIQAIMTQSRDASANTRAALRADEEQIHAAMFSSGSVTASQLEALMQRRESEQATLDAARVSTIMSVRGVLTAEQLATASSLHAKLASLREQEHALMNGGSGNSVTPAE